MGRGLSLRTTGTNRNLRVTEQGIKELLNYLGIKMNHKALGQWFSTGGARSKSGPQTHSGWVVDSWPKKVNNIKCTSDGRLIFF